MSGISSASLIFTFKGVVASIYTIAKSTGMKRFFPLLLLISCINYSWGQDVFTRGMVYQVPAMKNTVIKTKLAYRNIHDTVLHFDIYYPPGFNFKNTLPLVIFNNGVGSMDIPEWGIYKDWARLGAANGLIAVNHQSRNGSALEDGEALIDHLIKNATELNIDTGKIGLWTCSANARTGMRLAYKTRPANFKALVVYYGGPDSLGQLRQDLPTMMVRAGLDAQFLNTGIDNFIQSSLQQDTRLEVINYVNGVHAFDAFTNTDESKAVIVRTIEFLKKNLLTPVTDHAFVLTNKNFMWLILNNQMSTALNEFRLARTKYRADSSFQPFFNAVIREDVLNANAYWLMSHQHENDAFEVFKLAVESYPESPNALESLSECYEHRGNNAEAIRYAELCLQKLPAATGMNEDFKQRVKRSAEDRIKKLTR
jgi:dienelactone hydrolase